MPTYEYKCANGHTWETIQSITEKPLSKCPKCKAAARRVINGGMGVIFKGSGFYTTDYKKSSSLTGANGKKTESSSGTESSKNSTSEGAKDSSSGGSKDKGSKESGSKEKAAAS